MFKITVTKQLIKKNLPCLLTTTLIFSCSLNLLCWKRVEPRALFDYYQQLRRRCKNFTFGKRGSRRECVPFFFFIVPMLRAHCSSLDRSDKLFHYPRLQSLLPIACPYLPPPGPHTHACTHTHARTYAHTSAGQPDALHTLRFRYGRGGAC